MKQDEYVFKDIKRLETPVGYFSITDGEKEIPFSVMKKSYSVDIYGGSDEVLREVNTDTHYSIALETKNLDLGKLYNFLFSSVLEEAQDDDGQYSRYGTIGNCVVGIGMFNPNDEDELDQCFEYSKKMGIEHALVEPPFYDEKNFHIYSMKYSDDRKGFVFKLLDRSREIIFFDAVWITEGEYSLEDCEEAVEIWVL